MTGRVPLYTAQKRLTVVWFAGAGLVLAVLIFQTVIEKYGSRVEDAYSWYAQTVLPTATLIASALAYQAAKKPKAVTVDQFWYRFSLWVSVAYIALVVVTPFLEPLSPRAPLEFLHLSNLWLGPVHIFVGITLGVFFGSKDTAAGP